MGAEYQIKRENEEQRRIKISIRIFIRFDMYNKAKRGLTKRSHILIWFQHFIWNSISNWRSFLISSLLFVFFFVLLNYFCNNFKFYVHGSGIKNRYGIVSWEQLLSKKGRKKNTHTHTQHFQFVCIIYQRWPFEWTK